MKKPGQGYPALPIWPIDEEIKPLLDVMRSVDWMTTLGSCCGHERQQAYVDFAVRHDRVRTLATLVDHVQDAVANEDIFLECTLIFSKEVATSCDFAQYPDWVMFSLCIGSDEVAPSTEDLDILAAAMKRKLKQEKRYAPRKSNARQRTKASV